MRREFFGALSSMSSEFPEPEVQVLLRLPESAPTNHGLDYSSWGMAYSDSKVCFP